MGLRIVYITCATFEQARVLGLQLVEERLVACVNLLPGMQSIYHWQDKIETAEECVIIAKTTQEMYAGLEKRIVELHTYECPCIIAWDVVDGHSPYLDWIRSNAVGNSK